MATSMDTVSPASLIAPEHSMTGEEGPTSFFCRQCQSPYKQPKILTCLHSFCSQCLLDVLEKSSDKQHITCPLCACVTKVPAGGVTDLTSNSFLHRISNEYVKEVKHNLASKSLRDGSGSTVKAPATTAYGTTSAATPDIKTVLQDELEQQRLTNLTDEEKSETSRVLNSAGGSNSSSRSSSLSTHGKSSSAVTVEPQTSSSTSDANLCGAIQNMNRLQAKSMGLQGEALRVTYAIDHVNNHKEEWLQRREDLKRAIQRRSAQFQSLVKKMERQLISQIEDKGEEDKFHDSLDRGKTELRKNLKQVLHEVSVIKSVREMGSYEEINELSAALLSPSVGVGEVILDNIKYQFDLPTKSIEEMVRVGFGNLVTSHEQKTVYTPELKDYATMNMAEITSVEEKSHSTAFKTRGILSAISGDSSVKMSGYRSSSVVGRQTRRRASDVGKADSVLEEFQNARESLRNRRQEILRQGQSTREASPWRGGGTGGAAVAATARRVSRPAVRRGRSQVQSLDRSSNAREDTKLLSKLKTTAGSSTAIVKGEDSTDPFTSSVEVYDVSTGGLTDSYKVEDTITTTMPSPIIEEASPAIDSPRRGTTPKLTTTVSSPIAIHRQRTISSTSNDASCQESTRSARGHGPISTSSSTSSSRRVSFDMSPSMSPTSENFPMELFGKNIENSRQLRKAITGAADKKAKIEFLRENWQRRKEILIQTRGFVSSEEAGSAAKPDSSTVTALITEHTATTPENGATKYENSTYTEIPLASRGIGSPPLRSKFTSLRKNHVNEKRYQISPETSSRSSSTSGGSPNVPRKSEIPASILDNELRKIESSHETQMNAAASFAPINGSNQTLHPNMSLANSTKYVKNHELKKDDDEDEEENVVVETETISIPMTTELLQDMKSPQKEVKIPSTAAQPVLTSRPTPGLQKQHSQSSTSHNPEEDEEEEEEEETFYEDTMVVPLPTSTVKTPSLYSSITTTRSHQLPSQSRTALINSSSTSATSISRTPSTTTTAETGSGTATFSTTTTMPSSKITLSPDISRSSYYRPSTTATSSTLPVKGDDATDARRTMASTTDRTPSFYRRAGGETEQATITPQQQSQLSAAATAASSPSTTQLNSSITPSDVTTKTKSSAITNNTTAATTSSTVTSNRTSTSSLYQSSTTTTTTTTTTASSSSSTSSYSTSSSYSSRRYIPRTETIDVAALLSNFYKTTSSPATPSSNPDRDAKSKASEDNKENVGDKGTTGNAVKTQTRVETQATSLLNNKTNTNNSSIKTDSLTKNDTPGSTNKTDIASNTPSTSTTQPRYGTSFLRNYSNTSTESRYNTNQQTPAKAETEKHVDPTSTVTSSVNSGTTTVGGTKDVMGPDLKTSNNANTDKTQSTASTSSLTTTTTTTSTTTRKYTATTSSLYSRYYSMPNPLYSKPAEPTNTPSTSDTSDRNNTTNNTTTSNSSNTNSTSRQTAHDQKVHDTFTQAESARRVYEPPTTTSSDTNRRHTADIGRTIPSGVKLSDLYSRPATTTLVGSNTTDTNVTCTKVLSPQSTTTITESPAESSYQKDVIPGISQQKAPHSLYQYQPSSIYTAESSSSSGGARLTKQYTLPDKLDFKSPTSPTHTGQLGEGERHRKTSPGGQMVMSLSFHHDLSTHSSPASSPLMEENELFTQSGQMGDSSGAMASSSGNRSLKEIARKKREKWRRLTVY